MVRRCGAGLELLLVHPGGPYFRNRDDGVWTIPKGLVNPGEELFAAACREFEEETGVPARAPAFVSLGHVRQKAGKIVHAWAFEGDCDPSVVRSNTFEIEWPRRSGRRQVFPEIDRAAFFTPAMARQKILPAQEPFVDRVLQSPELLPHP